jgi:diamine N-acetyltransferase
LAVLPPFQLRYGVPGDCLLLSRLGIETFTDSVGEQNSPENMAAYLARAFSPEQQAGELAVPGSRFLIVESEGVPAGYARTVLGPAPAEVRGRRPMEIVRFYARKSWIGRGVGPFLMRACLVEAQREGCDVVWLSVWEKNPRGIAFYRKWGFREVGSRAFQLGDDRQRDLVMARDLTAGLASP